MMQRSRYPIVSVLMALTLAGCGSTDDPNGGNGPGSPGGEAARSAAPAAGTDIAIPLPEGAEAVSTNQSGPLTIVQFTVPLDRQAGTIAFYDEWTAARSDDYERVEAESGGVSWQNAPAARGEKHIIAVLSPLEGDDFVTVTLTVGPAE